MRNNIKIFTILFIKYYNFVLFMFFLTINNNDTDFKFIK